MSDALTDIYRDQRRDDYFSIYMVAIHDYLIDQTDKKLKFVIKCADDTDSVPRGYLSSQTQLSEYVVGFMNDLINNDKKQWLKLLRMSKEVSNYIFYRQYKQTMYDKLKSMSPFNGKIIISIDYGVGFATIRGDLEQLIGDYLKSKDLCTYDCDRYSLIIDKIDIEEHIHQYNSCHGTGYNTPVSSERSKLQGKP